MVLRMAFTSVAGSGVTDANAAKALDAGTGKPTADLGANETGTQESKFTAAFQEPAATTPTTPVFSPADRFAPPPTSATPPRTATSLSFTHSDSDANLVSAHNWEIWAQRHSSFAAAARIYSAQNLQAYLQRVDDPQTLNRYIGLVKKIVEDLVSSQALAEIPQASDAAQNLAAQTKPIDYHEFFKTHLEIVYQKLHFSSEQNLNEKILADYFYVRWGEFFRHARGEIHLFEKQGQVPRDASFSPQNNNLADLLRISLSICSQLDRQLFPELWLEDMRAFTNLALRKKQEVLQLCPDLKTDSSTSLTDEAKAVSTGYFPLALFDDARFEKVVIPQRGPVQITDRWGKRIGLAQMFIGGELGSFTGNFSDKSFASAASVNGYTLPAAISSGQTRGAAMMEDGSYSAAYKLPDNSEVKIQVCCDGMGGTSGAHIASSAFIQGVHAKLTECARTGEVPLLSDLFYAGKKAFEFQKMAHSADRAGTTAMITLIYGDKAYALTCGDGLLVHLRPQKNGSFSALGVNETDVGFDSRNPDKRNAITRAVGTALYNLPDFALYEIDLQAGDVLIMGTDGVIDNLVGKDYKDHTAPLRRTGLDKKNLTKAHLLPLGQMLRAYEEGFSPGNSLAQMLMALVKENIANPGQTHEHKDENNNTIDWKMPPEASVDHLTVMVYRHGSPSNVAKNNHHASNSKFSKLTRVN